MESFLSRVVSSSLKEGHDQSKICYVLPNQRAGVFLRNELKRKVQTPGFLPEIISIADLINKVSKLEVIDQVTLLFEFYQVYIRILPKQEQDPFQQFSKWATVLLTDFSELDANLIDAHQLFDHLHDLKKLDQWGLDPNSEDSLASNYLRFFGKIKGLYTALEDHLLSMKQVYQGLAYREATRKIEDYLSTKKDIFFVFAGFNALNKAEEVVIQKFLDTKQCSVYWDHDTFYNQTHNQSAVFTNSYRKKWPYYRDHPFLWEQENINSQKKINITGVPKQVSQVKYIATLLEDIQAKGELNETALILGNEQLLPVVLNSLPLSISEANITMGYELNQVPMASFFRTFFLMHINRQQRKQPDFFYKDIELLLQQSVFRSFLIQHPRLKEFIDRKLYTENHLFLESTELKKLSDSHPKEGELIKSMFLYPSGDVKSMITSCLELIKFFKDQSNGQLLMNEHIYQFYLIFQELQQLNANYGSLEDLESLFQFYITILSRQKINFQGEPLKGLQIMGLLETRSLDFKHLIICSVNEGHLPSQGKGNSFLPSDIKMNYQLPGYYEKEAIFAYHFFRLLHRCETAHLIYNNVTDDFGGGEPSRFIKQLQTAKSLGLLDKVTIEQQSILLQIPNRLESPLIIEKNAVVLEQLTRLSQKGFSPTSLSMFVRDPIMFYKRYVLGIKETEGVEEHLAANTFGTIVHDSLENLYRDHIGKELSLDVLSTINKKIRGQVNKHYEKHYGPVEKATGRNYLSLEIAFQFVSNFVQQEIKNLKEGHRIRIIDLEKKVSSKIPLNGLREPVILKGFIDRIDEFDGQLRIVDYKTGKVQQHDLNYKDDDELFNDHRLSKAFQVLCYAYLYHNSLPDTRQHQAIESGIISFKNLGKGFMKVNNRSINRDEILSFESGLKQLLSNLFDGNQPFLEPEEQLSY